MFVCGDVEYVVMEVVWCYVCIVVVLVDLVVGCFD